MANEKNIRDSITVLKIMANEKNIKDSINALKRVRDRGGKFNLKSWQELHFLAKISTTEEELHGFGMAASIGGWIALSPEFKAAGGTVDYMGCPWMNGENGMDAMKEYWDIPLIKVELICDCDQFTMEYYGVDNLEDITIDMAIEAVESLLKLED